MDLSFGLTAKTKYKMSNALFVLDLHNKNLFTKYKYLLPSSVSIKFVSLTSFFLSRGCVVDCHCDLLTFKSVGSKDD